MTRFMRTLSNKDLSALTDDDDARRELKRREKLSKKRKPRQELLTDVARKIVRSGKRSLLS